MRLVSLLGLAVVSVVAPATVFAADPPPPVADSPCDPDYYDTLEARAWLEAEREVTQNQNLILKPDSVLRYSCFDTMMDDYASNSSSMFSGGADVSVPKDTADSWVSDNFSGVHSNALGGRSDETSALGGGCGAMEAIWEDAQCMDFVDEPDYDAFFSLADYVDGDDKRFEGNCTKPTGWAENSDNLKPENTAWEEDDLLTYFLEFDHDEGCDSSKEIETGIQAIPQSGPAYDVKVCVRVGCVYGAEDTKCIEYAP